MFVITAVYTSTDCNVLILGFAPSVYALAGLALVGPAGLQTFLPKLVTVLDLGVSVWHILVSET